MRALRDKQQEQYARKANGEREREIKKEGERERERERERESTIESQRGRKDRKP